MKKLTFLSVIIMMTGMVALQSCKKEINKKFDMNAASLFFHTNAHPQFNSEMVLVDTLVPSELKSVLSSNGIDLDKVSGVYLRHATLTIVDPSLSNGANFDPYDYANAHIQAGTKAQEQLAYIGGITPNGLTELSFESQAQNLKEFLTEDQIRIMIKGYNTAVLPATDYRLDLRYEIDYSVKE